MVEKPCRVTCILAGDQVHFFQNAQRPKCEVFEVADRRGYKKQRGLRSLRLCQCLRLSILKSRLYVNQPSVSVSESKHSLVSAGFSPRACIPLIAGNACFDTPTVSLRRRTLLSRKRRGRRAGAQ